MPTNVPYRVVEREEMPEATFTGSQSGNMWVNTTGERLFLNADKDKVLKEGDPESAYLLAAPGAMIPMAEAAGYGLVEGKTPRDFMAPVEQEAADATEAHNFRAAAQTLRTKQFARGIYMTEDEALAQVKKDAGKEEVSADADADADVKAQASASDKSVAGPASDKSASASEKK